MKKILLVDDDEDTLDIVKYILTAKGFDVYILCTGLNVPEIVKNYNPDLILIDILLSGKSGTEICKELKRIYHMPIILFSGNTAKGEAFATCGADDFLQKPFDLNDLLNTVNFHLYYDHMEV